MKKSKLVFLGMALLFFIIVIVIGHDISSRTTWPGSKPQLKERIIQDITPSNDSTVGADSLQLEE